MYISGTGYITLAYTYEYDKNGNRTKISLADSAGTMSSDTAYAYDALNRLSSEVRTGGSANYTKYYYFDSVGNRTMLLEFAGPPGPPVVTNYSYNAGEQLTALTKSRYGVVSENRAYQYDAAGQMTRVADTAAGVTKTFSWDHLGRMTHAEVNAGGVTKSVDYASNPAGKRFMRVAGGVTKAWTYQGDNIASVESTTSPTLHSVYSGSGLGGVVERDDVDTAGGGSTTSRFYLYNHRGDVVGVCDAAGNLTSAYDYDAYGAVSQSAQSGGGSAPTDDILFTGKDLDPDTGLYYFNARWYDSESGRFVSRTRLRPDVEGPYQFCANSPVGYVDTDGRWFWPVAAALVGAGVGAIMAWAQGKTGAQIARAALVGGIVAGMASMGSAAGYALGEAAAEAAFGAIGAATTGAGLGAATVAGIAGSTIGGAAAGAASGAVTGGASAYIDGCDVAKGAKNGAIRGAIGGAIGGFASGAGHAAGLEWGDGSLTFISGAYTDGSMGYFDMWEEF